MNLWEQPKEVRNSIQNRIDQLSANIDKYYGDVTRAQNALDSANYHLNKSKTELTSLIEQYNISI